LKQAGDDVVIDGRTTVLTSLTDFVTNLEGSGYFKKSIDIVNTATEAGAGSAAELIKFSIKASFQQPDAKPTPAGSAASKAGG
jgi:Tfp pilus assembly protein PilN